MPMWQPKDREWPEFGKYWKSCFDAELFAPNHGQELIQHFSKTKTKQFERLNLYWLDEAFSLLMPCSVPEKGDNERCLSVEDGIIMMVSL